MTNFTNYSLLRQIGQAVVMLVKLTTNTHPCSWLLQLHYGPPFWFWMKSIGLHRKAAKTSIKSTIITQIIISRKHAMLVYNEKYNFNVYMAK